MNNAIVITPAQVAQQMVNFPMEGTVHTPWGRMDNNSIIQFLTNMDNENRLTVQPHHQANQPYDVLGAASYFITLYKDLKRSITITYICRSVEQHIDAAFVVEHVYYRKDELLKSMRAYGGDSIEVSCNMFGQVTTQAMVEGFLEKLSKKAKVIDIDGLKRMVRIQKTKIEDSSTSDILKYLNRYNEDIEVKLVYGFNGEVDVESTVELFYNTKLDPKVEYAKQLKDMDVMLEEFKVRCPFEVTTKLDNVFKEVREMLLS